MLANLQDDLVRIAQAFRLDASDSFSFAGGPVINATERVQYYPRWQESGDEDSLFVVVRRVIYYQCYARPFQGCVAGSDAEASVADEADADFIARLSNANQGQPRWDPFWKIYRISQENEIQVQKGDVHRRAVPGEYSFNAGPHVQPREQQLVSLQVLTESVLYQPHFYFCFGEELSDRFDDFHCVRFYFNIESPDAVRLIEFLTRELNRFQIPFRLKCPTSPNGYDRTDAAVLYVASRWLQMTSQIVARLVDVLPNLASAVPLFTRTLFPGIGFAEDPGEDRSFGETRCGLVAQGICNAWLQTPEPTDDEFLSAIQSEFEASGISLQQPWLNPGSIDPTDLASSNDLCETVEVNL
jgi:hypothetical protein